MRVLCAIGLFFLLSACSTVKVQSDRKTSSLPQVKSVQCLDGALSVLLNDEGVLECARRFFHSQELIAGGIYGGVDVRELSFTRKSGGDFHIRGRVSLNKNSVGVLKEVHLVLSDDKIELHEGQELLPQVSMTYGGTYCEGQNVGSEWACAQRVAYSKLVLDGYKNLKLRNLKKINSSDDPEGEDERSGVRTYSLKFRAFNESNLTSYYIGLLYEQSFAQETDGLFNFVDNTRNDFTIRSLKESSMD